MMDRYIGQEFSLNAGGRCVIIDFKNSKDVTIKHLDEYGHFSVVEYAQLKRGTVKNPYYKSVCGVGYLGVGNHRTRIGKSNTDSYVMWKGMIYRCYSEVAKNKNPTYKGCTVHPDWHNFQVFAEWYSRHESFGLGYELDKDILLRGNKVYSADTCCLVPSVINSSIIFPKDRFGKILGVTERVNRRCKFEVYARLGGVKKYLGNFETPEEAFEVYKNSKEDYLKYLAEDWKNRISDNVYNALCNWEIY